MTAITQSVDLDRRGRIAVLTVNNPPVNALSQHVRQGLYDGVTRATADAAVGAVVVTCAGRTFIAGADRSEEHTSELQSHSDLVCRLLLEKKKKERRVI